MEADFDIDAAFDEVVDRFVSEYVPVMKEIAAKFDAVRESLTNPPVELQRKYDNRGASIAHAFAGNLDQALS